jgi:hypothetical protein
MILDEAIIHAEEVADRCEITDGDCKCAAEHRQLAEWLKKLKKANALLEAQKWIPCNPLELPKDKKLWVTHDRWGCRYVDEVFWDMTEWSDDVSDVVAYMPYVEPEPYKEEV